MVWWNTGATRTTEPKDELEEAEAGVRARRATSWMSASLLAEFCRFAGWHLRSASSANGLYGSAGSGVAFAGYKNCARPRRLHRVVVRDLTNP